jgi:hypothetical protein
MGRGWVGDKYPQHTLQRPGQLHKSSLHM